MPYRKGKATEKCVPTLLCARDKWHEPCQIVKRPLLRGVAVQVGRIETSPLSARGEVSNALVNLGRGGARNHASRQSLFLSKKHASNLIAACRHAGAIGLPLNRMITVHWERAGVPLESMSKATGRFLDLLSKALSRHGSSTSWVWVHENGDRKGGHCHLLAHVRSDLTPLVAALQKGWLRRISGRPYRSRVIRSRPIGGRLGLEINNPGVHQENLNAALAYLLKGVDPNVASELGLERLEPGGLVIGKRCGVSQNLGPTAREKARSES